MRSAELYDSGVFLDPGALRDRELELVCVDRTPADPSRNFVPAYHFEMRVGAGTVGTIRFRIGDDDDLRLYAGHLGYGVEPAARGQHYAARSIQLLVPLIARHGFSEIWITCDPANAASRRTCELAGAELVEIIDLPADNDQYRDGERQKCRYRLVVQNGMSSSGPPPPPPPPP